MAISLPFILSNKNGPGFFQAAKSSAPAAASFAEQKSTQDLASEPPSDKNSASQVADGLVAVRQTRSAAKTEAQAKNNPAESKAVNEAPQREADSTKKQGQ